MEENIVIAVTLNCEAARNPGYFTRLWLLAIRVVHYICRRDPNITNSSNSPAGFASPDERSSPAGFPLPTQVPERPPQHRNPVQAIYIHPIILTIREQELGKSILNLGAPITVALLARNPRTFLMDFVLIGLSTGCVAIWNGITLRVHVPRTANVVEQLGIAMVLISFNALVASALPIEFAWIPVLSGALSLLPLAIAALPRGDVDAANQHAADAG
ncbi:UNVERIFIED_CONTAM: hypothetical protein Sradi_6805700 [Sesamum radiatum]|uniref:Uncharacterized protein n=1 Tax=Sesamum radiatum TaxID=300843 RepID=A0AAW2JVM3_SESRA